MCYKACHQAGSFLEKARTGRGSRGDLLGNLPQLTAPSNTFLTTFLPAESHHVAVTNSLLCRDGITWDSGNLHMSINDRAGKWLYFDWQLDAQLWENMNLPLPSTNISVLSRWKQNIYFVIVYVIKDPFLARNHFILVVRKKSLTKGFCQSFNFFCNLGSMRIFSENNHHIFRE